MEPLRMPCAYCDRVGTLYKDIEMRNDKFVCSDVEACDAREAAVSSQDGEDD